MSDERKLDDIKSHWQVYGDIRSESVEWLIAEVDRSLRLLKDEQEQCEIQEGMLRQQKQTIDFLNAELKGHRPKMNAHDAIIRHLKAEANSLMGAYDEVCEEREALAAQVERLRAALTELLFLVRSGIVSYEQNVGVVQKAVAMANDLLKEGK